MRAVFLLLGVVVVLTQVSDQLQAQETFTRADTLRGALRPERTAYDVIHYAIQIDVHPADSSVFGAVAIAFRGTFEQDVLQLDLDAGLRVVGILQGKRPLTYTREADAVFVKLYQPTQAGQLDTLTVRYEGRPPVAKNAPWDGGFTWATDSLGRPWIAVSCEGIGASKWWPNKDHLSDEPDSMRITVSVPNPLRVISNGQLRESRRGQDRSYFTYATTYPINNYNVTFYAGHYLTWNDTLGSPAHASPLALNYAAIDYNLERAKRHFAQVKPMLRCYEDVLGPYPFWEDGYALVEAPYLGMEHQSAIAYGNDYMRGYRGGMIPAEMDWDYLIIHESGHEYFGNALSVSDHAEMWLHESFTTYLEALYVECRYGYDDYLRYLAGQVGYIGNAHPIVGPVGVNYEHHGSDHYFKGSWVLHTFRSLVGDEAFLKFLRAFYEMHAIGIVTTADWTAAVSETFGDEYDIFWQQYLHQAAVPRLRFSASDAETTTMYFENVVPGFAMPLRIGSQQVRITDQPKSYPVSAEDWATFEPRLYLLEYQQLGGTAH